MLWVCAPQIFNCFLQAYRCMNNFIRIFATLSSKLIVANIFCNILQYLQTATTQFYLENLQKIIAEINEYIYKLKGPVQK